MMPTAKKLFPPWLLILISVLFLLPNSHLAQGNTKTCTVNGAIGWYPIIFREAGQVRGIAIDILKSFQQKSAVSIEVGAEVPWIRLEDQIKKGSLDMVAGAFYAKRRTEFGRYSKAFFKEEVAIFVTHNNQFQFTGVQDLIGKTGMRPASGSYGEEFDQFAAQHLEIQNIFGTETMFRMLLANRADYLVLAKLDGLNWLKKMGLENKVIALPQPAAVNDVYFLFSKNGQCLDIVDSLNAHLTSLQASEDWQALLMAY